VILFTNGYNGNDNVLEVMGFNLTQWPTEMIKMAEIDYSSFNNNILNILHFHN